jgi:hypothetical protein
LNTKADFAWAPYAQMLAGAWLAAGSWTFGYGGTPEAWSDLAGGLVLMALAGLSLRPRGGVAAQWASAGVGVWLMLAPLAFWADSAAAYVNSTLVGSLAVTFAILTPRNALETEARGTDVPPGWSYNPSAWSQRAPIIAMAFLGFFIAQYLAAFQLGYHDAPWDPFFGDGTRRVLTSSVSKAFPVSDAGLGAVAYLVEALTGFAGGTRRWRTMPWLVLVFGFMVVPAGVVSIVLIILQPVAVGAWCGFCLITAVTTLLMISPAADEIVATLQFLGRARREGRLWVSLWKGGKGDRTGAGSAPLASSAANDREGPSWIANALGLNTITPTLALSAALGAWLMFSPAVFGNSGSVAVSDQLVGPLVITVAVIALAEVGRSVRWINLPFGLWLIAAPWILGGATGAGRWNDVAAGVLLVAFSVPRGKIEERYGGFERFLV